MNNSLLISFKRYLSTLPLGSISRKLYASDASRFLTFLGDATLDQVANPENYHRYLESLRSQASAPAVIRRSLASLRQFGTFLASSHSLPNPLQQGSELLGVRNLAPTLTSKYIKLFTDYLNSLHLSPLTLKSYKSDITRYLDYCSTHLSSTDIAQVLKSKNRQKYLTYLSQSHSLTPTTLERKDQSLTRFATWYHTVYFPANVTDNLEPLTSTPTTTSHPHSPLTSLDVDLPRVKKFNYRNLISLAILLLFTATLAVFGYRQFSRDVTLTQAYPSTPVTPNRQLSFQGRLENSSGTPITTATNMVFKLFTASSGGTELYSTGTCSIDPDADGVFSTQIGDTCGSAIASSVFTENQDVWLEVTVVAETLTPRQQIATVAYALNAETLQGFPLSSTVSAIRNTVVPMNQWGEILIGEQSPRLTGVSGTLAISAPALSITTTTGTNGNISLAPDGTGQVNVTGNTTTTNFFNVSNAQLTSGSLITGTAANANTGFKLFDLLSGSSPTSKFSVTDAGNTTVGGDLTISGDDLIMGTNTSGMVLIADGTNFNPTAVSGDITINSSGTTTIGNDKVTEAHLKVVDTATDEECLTYETTTGDFEWQTCAAIAADSLDFTEFKDALALDASTSIAFDASEVLSFDVSTVDTTTTGGVLDFNIDAGNAAVIGLNTDFTQSDGATAGTDATAQVLNLSANDADGDVFGLAINALATANAAAGSYEAGLKIDNAENTVASMTDAILVTATTDTATTTGLNVADAELVNAISIGANLIEGTNFDVATTGNITVAGTTGLDTNATGELRLGYTNANIISIGNTAATSIGLGQGGSLTRTFYIGNGTGADTINIGTGGTTADDINIGGLATTRIDLLGMLYFGGSTYYVDTSGGPTNGDAKFHNIIATDTGLPSITAGDGTTGYIKIGGSFVQDVAGNLTLDSDSNILEIASDNTTLTASGLTTINAGAALTLNSTSYTRIGDTATPGTATGDDDLFVESDLEVDGKTYLDGSLYIAGDVSTATLSAIPATYNNTNILPNPSFEVEVVDSTNVDGWTQLVVAGSGTVTRVPANSHDGTYSMALNTTPATTGNDYILSNRQPVSPSTNYTTSVWTKEDSTDCVDGFYLRVRWLDNAGTYISDTSVYTNSGAVTSTWTLFQGDVTSPSNAYFTQVWISNYQPNNACILYVDQVSLRPMLDGDLLINGYVGIGADNPNYELHLHQGATASNTFMQFTQDGTGTATTDGFVIGVNDTEAAIINNREATNLYIQVNGNNSLTLDSSGNATLLGDYTITGNDIVFGNAENISNATNGTVLIQDNATTTLISTSTTTTSINLSAQVGGTAQRLCHNGADAATGVQAIGDCGATQADLAEYYGVLDNSQAGEIVAVTNNAISANYYDGQTTLASVIKSTTPYQPGVIGVVSTNPSGEVLGETAVPYLTNPTPIALIGRTPVKVTTENGPIKVGDLITSSSLAGTGMKSTQPGYVIGRALSSYNSTDPTQVGEIIVFVSIFWADPTLALDEFGNLPILAATEVKTNLLSPLAPDQPIQVQAPVIINPSNTSAPELVVEGEIQADSISARTAKLDSLEVKNIVVDRLFANHIEGLDAKIATLSAHTANELSDSELETITSRIKDRLSSLTATDAGTAADLPIPQEATASQIPSGAEGEVGPPSASDSATLISLDADFVTINQYLAVLGSASITTLSVNQDLFVDKITSQTGTLALQPTGGVINLADSTLIVDSAGSVAVNGTLSVTGALALHPDATSPLGKLLQVFDEQGLEVASIDASGSATLADVTTQLITIASGGVATPSSALATDVTTNATAGNSVLLAPNTELTINSPYVTGQTLVYLTPTANTDNKVLFVKSKTDGSFTVAIDAPATTDIPFNWWIIQLAPPNQ